MKNLLCLAWTWMLTLTVWSQDIPPPPQADPSASKLAALEKAATLYVEAYNKRDAAALATIFLPEGELNLANGEVISGRDSIKAFYQEIFNRPEKSEAALEAGAVRFVTPGIAIEDGTLHFTTPSGELTSHFYHATRVQQADGTWLTASVRDEIEDLAPPAEKLLGLEWMLGDWIVQKEGSTSDLSFNWSSQGPFIEGRALTHDSENEHITSTYRIAWDPRRKGFISWGFDTSGGFSQSDWVKTGDNSWLIRTKGITSDGEVNQATQTLTLDASQQFFTWGTHDQVIADEPQPDQSLKVVKRPPSLDTKDSKDIEAK